VVVERDDPALVRRILRLRRGPVAMLDSTFRDLPVIGVVDGSFEGARRAVLHLLHLGHRRIAYFAPGEAPEAPHEKTQGYQAALAEAAVACDPQLVFHARDEAAGEQAAAAVARLLALADPPTALFAGTDRRALAAVRALEARGRRVGADFAVIGFGDSAWRSGESDRLSSVRIHTRQMGEAAVQAVLAAGRAPTARTVIVADRLILRQSTCRREHCGRARRAAGAPASREA
jgi:LacI family transcriptional regulator